MRLIAIKMLMGDRAKYLGLIFGIAFMSFLVTFAASYFSGFMTRGFALISENSFADVWVMDPKVTSVEQTTNMPWWALDRVRSIDGARFAIPLVLGTADAHFADGHFQAFQIIGLDDASLAGLPQIEGMPHTAKLLRTPNSVVVATGGSSGKLDVLSNYQPLQQKHNAPTELPIRELTQGDELLVNDHLIRIAGKADALPRFPPRPLLYAPLSRALAILLPERRQITFILVKAESGVSASELAARIEASTGLRARTASDFKTDTVRWFLENSEDVGDIASMLILAISVGFGMTGVMLYMFTAENLPQYAVLRAMGATRKMLLSMIFAQSGLAALIGTGLGFGLCGIAGQFAGIADFPFRIMWITPLAGGAMVIIVSLVAALLSARPVLKLNPVLVFAGR
jgi:putative ABC transport system permease protein